MHTTLLYSYEKASHSKFIVYVINQHYYKKLTCQKECVGVACSHLHHLFWQHYFLGVLVKGQVAITEPQLSMTAFPPGVCHSRTCW